MFKRLIFVASAAVALALVCLQAADLVFPYGAVYFRKSNPPEDDWARDHKTAADIGMNIFRHWFMWSAIEVAPGKYDWRDYDRMMDLAAENGLKVVIAEMVTAAPEWAFDDYAHARFRGSDDSIVHSSISGSSATGGFPGLCLDNEDARALAEKFLTALVERYRNHPAILGYDIWNENTYRGGSPRQMYCYCEATQQKFREWLRDKYGSIDALGKAWGRHSFGTWDHLHPPRSFSGYADSLDWLEFRIDDAFRLMKWRVDLFRRLDAKNKIVAHGVAGTLDSLPNAAHHEWRSASLVETWGFTWVASRKGAEPWKQFHAVDLVRAGSRGKPFWHAEAQAGPLWMQPQVPGRAREDGRITDEKDVRLWNMISAAGGATGILYPRWRPLLDGPLFGAFGAFGMDGSVTPRAEMAGKVARWANANPEIWKSRPVKGEVGIVFVPESEIFNYVQQGDTGHYAQAARGAYQAFFDSNIQADWVHIDDIKEYPLVYLPYPVMLKEETARKLIAYVEQGGNLVAEGVPAYFGDRGHVGEVQPNFGLDKLFGARESYVEFTPDLLEDLTLTVRGEKVHGRYFLQKYSLVGGQQAGSYDDGDLAAVENSFGKGKALLIGTFPSGGYYRYHDAGTRAFFNGLLEWSGRKQQIFSSDPEVKARLHDGLGGRYLWVVNPAREPRVVTVNLASTLPPVQTARDLWQNAPVTVHERELKLKVGDRDVAVVRLE